jgi:hypothetical protein
MNRCCIATAVVITLGVLAPCDAVGNPLRRVFQDDFSDGADRWEPTDTTAWKVVKKKGGAVYSQHKKRSNYEPPHRSPYNISLVRDIQVTDFEFTARVLSTHEDYGHRDVCLFFGYQDPAHFYYVHLGKKADDHANQVFIVNGAARIKISTKTTEGTDWDQKWHTVRITRDSQSGAIAVFFDDMKTPVMTAIDTTFRWGRVGVGSFDDTGDWDDIRLKGNLHHSSPDK